MIIIWMSVAIIDVTYLNGSTHDEALGVLLVSYAGLLNNNANLNDFLTRKIKKNFIELQNEYLIKKYLIDESDTPVEEDNGPHLELK